MITEAGIWPVGQRRHNQRDVLYCVKIYRQVDKIMKRHNVLYCGVYVEVMKERGELDYYYGEYR